MASDGNETIFKYLRFAVLQRNQQIKELKIALADFKKSRIEVDETYSSDDVTEMVDNLGEIIAADTVRDLQRAAHTTVVLLQQVIGQARAAGIAIDVDTSLLEDEILLNAAADLEKESEKPAVPSALESAPSLKQMKLVSLDNQKQAMNLEVELAQCKERLKNLQTELTGVNREKTHLKEALIASETKAASLFEFANARTDAAEAGALKNIAGSSAEGGGVEVLGEVIGAMSGGSAAAAGGSGSGSALAGGKLSPMGVDKENGGGGGGAGDGLRVKELERLVGDLQDKVDVKSKAAEELEAALQDRLDKAPQFRTLKDMLGKKNGQLREMRELLKGYGWVDPDES